MAVSDHSPNSGRENLAIVLPGLPLPLRRARRLTRTWRVAAKACRRRPIGRGGETKDRGCSKKRSVPCLYAGAMSAPATAENLAPWRLRVVLQKLWYDRPVRTQLLVAVGTINLLAMIVAGVVSILNTRTATRVEIEASLEVAQRFVEATIKDLSAQGKIDQLNEQLPLELKHLRHVRIMFMDEIGQLTFISPWSVQGEGAGVEPYVPSWFARLVRPQLVGRAVRVVTVEGASPIVIVGEPADEIAEAWHDFSSLAIVLVSVNVAVLAVLYVVLGRMLGPLASLSKGMLNLEDGHYGTRLAKPRVKELAVITDRFNMLAGALDTAREENGRLYRQLITV